MAVAAFPGYVSSQLGPYRQGSQQNTYSHDGTLVMGLGRSSFDAESNLKAFPCYDHQHERGQGNASD